MKWILLLVPLFFSLFTYATDYPDVVDKGALYEISNSSINGKGYTFETALIALKASGGNCVSDAYIKVGDINSAWIACNKLMTNGWQTYKAQLGSIYRYTAAPSCPDSHPTDNGDGTCSPYIPFCDRQETQEFMDNAVQQCADNVPLGSKVVKNTAICNTETESVDTECEYAPIGEGGDGGGSGGGDIDGGNDGSGGGGECSTILGGSCPPDSGDGSGGSDGGDGSGGGTNPDVPVTPENYCELYPDLCPNISPECIENPELCDVPVENPDVIANLAKITQLLQVNNTITATSAQNSGLVLTNDDVKIDNQINIIDKLETIKDNSKVTADNTDLVTDHLQNITDLNQYQAELLNELIAKPTGGGTSGDIMNSTNNRIDDTNAKLDEIKEALTEDKCAENSQDESCIPNQLTIVGCESFSCSGDKLKCASLELQHKSWCESKNIDWDKALNDPMLDYASKFDQTQLIGDEFDFSTPDQKYFGVDGINFASTGCPSPEVISIYGKNIEIPYDPFCWLAQYLRPFLEALSGIVAMTIAAKGIGRGL
ncbi:virulence factor TspB C-terminal domain-related protein [Photobacterium leiognathi]|uniref:virulence factor TspB C-terminal domain-related protein n=1 Tax=Photobacterium leiognathi TaxID=553611 RepID=UPI002981FEC5|nr:virulence factor TspB C-terminal domain-related protein [Photobacterium leiognathi]